MPGISGNASPSLDRFLQELKRKREAQAKQKRDRVFDLKKQGAIEKTQRDIRSAQNSELPSVFQFLKPLQEQTEFRNVPEADRSAMQKELAQENFKIQQRQLTQGESFERGLMSRRDRARGGETEILRPGTFELISAPGQSAKPAPLSAQALQQIFEQQRLRQQQTAPSLPQQPAPIPTGQQGGGMQGNPFIDILRKLFLGG